MLLPRPVHMLTDHMAVGSTPDRKRDHVIFSAMLAAKPEVLVDQCFRRGTQTWNACLPVKSAAKEGGIIQQLFRAHDALAVRCFQVLEDISRAPHITVGKNWDLESITDSSNCTKVGRAFTMFALAAKKLPPVYRQKSTARFLQQLGESYSTRKGMLQAYLAGYRDTKLCTLTAGCEHVSNQRPLELVIREPCSISALSGPALRATKIHVNAICLTA